MKRLIFVVLAFGSLSATPIADPASVQERPMTFAFGTTLCRNFIPSANPTTIQFVDWWIAGFVEGGLAAKGLPSPSLSLRALGQELERYCVTHPNVTFRDAALNILYTRPR